MVLLMLLALVGCPSSQETGPTLETGWFVDTGAVDTENCADQIVALVPEDLQTNWYWKDPLKVWTQTANAQAYDVQLFDAAGEELALSQQWSDDGLSFEVQVAQGLDGAASYRLVARDCAGEQEVNFETSVYGKPLLLEPSDLIGNAYIVDFGQADWVEPGGFGSILSLYFTTPVLFGVQFADATMVDFVGSQGWIDDLGGIHQYLAEPVWDFPIASFVSAPYFLIEPTFVEIAFSGVTVPIHDFSLAATFSDDGATMGGAVVRGLGDTRQMGGLVGSPDDPMAICELAASMGAPCEACPDDEMTCIRLRAEKLVGVLVPGLTLH